VDKKSPIPNPLPSWELPGVLILWLGVGYLLHLEVSLTVVLGTVAFLLHYVDNERERWQGLVEVVFNTNLAGLEAEQRLAHLEAKPPPPKKDQ
jgi:hypothetical protein